MSEYDRILEELNTDCIANYVISCNYGKTIEEIYYRIQEEYIKHTSTEWFSGDLVLLYPSIKERHATRFYTTFYESCINKGSAYINYNALLINLTRGTKYILKPSLKFEPGDVTPANILELEELERSTERNIQLKRVK